MPTKQTTSPKDVFLHLLSIAALYTSAGSFIALVFQYINIYLPDPLAGDYYLSGAYSTIRWSISSLIVVFPVYIWSMWYLNKLYKKSPDKKDLRIRKWLVYFTLFAAGLIIIGDLVALINNLLSGELTIRFLFKVLTILFVTGSVFGYYLWDIKSNRES